MSRNIALFIIVIVIVLAGVYYWRKTSADKAMANGDTVSPDNSVTTSLAPAPAPDPPPAPAPTPTPVKRSAVTVATPSVQQADTNLSAPPAADTIDRQPPNGMVFAGTGHMQVYRQGNITWRINTDTGDACILFATDREWRKPRVWQHGCATS